MVAREDQASDLQLIKNPFWFAAGVRAAQANVGTGTISHSLVTRLVTS